MLLACWQPGTASTWQWACEKGHTRPTELFSSDVMLRMAGAMISASAKQAASQVTSCKRFRYIADYRTSVKRGRLAASPSARRIGGMILVR